MLPMLRFEEPTLIDQIDALIEKASPEQREELLEYVTTTIRDKILKVG